MSTGALFSRRIFLRDLAGGAAAASLARSSGALAEQGPSVVPVRPPSPNRFNVRDFGASGDGTAKDTAAIKQALDRAGVFGGGEVLVPAGRYLTGGLALRSGVTLRLEQGAVLVGSPDITDYPVTQVRWEGKWIQGHIGLVHAIGAEKIGIEGPGRIEGCDALGGRPTRDSPLRHPALLEFLDCRQLLLEGFSTSYHSMWSIHPCNSEDIVCRNLTIRSTGGNGDGIDVDSCRRVLIEGCDIATGDDCISLKSGRGEEGYTLHRTTEDVRIVNCTLADSIFACIGIGSETSGGIRNVRIERCHFTEAKTHAIYIKSRVGRGAFVENIVGEDLQAANMRLGFLRLNQVNSGLQDEHPVPGPDGIPRFANFAFRRVHVEAAPVLVQAVELDPAKPLDGLLLEAFSGTCTKGISIANAQKVRLRKIDVQVAEGPLLQTANVTGAGLQGARPLPPAAEKPAPPK